MGLSIDTAASLRWATLQEAKDHLRVTSTAEDAYLSHLIAAVQSIAESITNRAILTTTYVYYLESLPSSGEIELPRPRVQSITHVKYYDSSNVLQTLAAGNYATDIISEPARIVTAYGVIWPTTYNKPNAVEIKYVAGYTAANFIPKGLVQAMYFLLAHLYDLRSPVVIGASVAQLPFAMDALFSPYRMRTFF